MSVTASCALPPSRAHSSSMTVKDSRRGVRLVRILWNSDHTSFVRPVHRGHRDEGDTSEGGWRREGRRFKGFASTSLLRSNCPSAGSRLRFTCLCGGVEGIVVGIGIDGQMGPLHAVQQGGGLVGQHPLGAEAEQHAVRPGQHAKGRGAARLELALCRDRDGSREGRRRERDA